MNAFAPHGLTVKFTAATSAPSPIQAANYEQSGMAGQYRLINNGSQTVFLGVGSTSAEATANATVITSTGKAIPILPGTDEILSFGFNAWFTGITSTGTAEIFITPGAGI
jgi:hypothetical protein